MPWSNVRFQDIEGQENLKLISADYTDDSEFRDPLTVTVRADPRNGEEIRRMCEEQLADSRKQLQVILNEEAILEILNAKPK